MQMNEWMNEWNQMDIDDTFEWNDRRNIGNK